LVAGLFLIGFGKQLAQIGENKSLKHSGIDSQWVRITANRN
jgi:hypothetical protein